MRGLRNTKLFKETVETNDRIKKPHRLERLLHEKCRKFDRDNFFALIVGKSFSYEYNLKYIRKKVRHQKKTPYKKSSASKKKTPYKKIKI